MASFLTWNINGINIPQKRRKIFHYLRQFKYDVICLQETHIRSSDQKYLINSRLGNHFIASAPEKKNGIVIYLKKDLTAKLIEADVQGRYLAIELLIEDKKILIVGVYAPNQQQQKFYQLLHTKILQWDYKSIIMLGDWNGVVDVQKDKKGLSQDISFRAKLPKAFFDMMEDLELRDVWREVNANEKDFTFFSDRHQSFSRIDFILTTNDFLSRVKKTKICPRTLTDHSPVWVELEQEKTTRRSWRLNENLFRYESNVNECKKYMKEFFALNMHKGTSMSMVWDASKAYMRGVLIHMNTRSRKKQQQKRLELEAEIKNKEKLLIKTPGDKIIKEAVNILKAQFNMLIADQVATNLQYAKHNTFCNANKPGRWLAYTLRKKQKSRIISKIFYKGKEQFKQDMIKKAFQEFYAKLYTQDTIQGLDIDKYLQQGNIQRLTIDQKEVLNRPITSDEIILAIKQLKTGKAPGTDGLTAIYYKNLQLEMIEPLTELFRKIQMEGEVPPSWRTAFISLIPKEDLDCTQPENFRPISLLNTDYKIFTKVLANRLMPVMQQIVHNDQSGFISGRQMRYNVRQIVNLLEYLGKNSQIPAALFFLDAEKAFDRLNWQFLFKILENMQFGECFIQSIRAIYQKQTAQLIVNGNLTEIFNIEKGTRQGCPLSPLLFILTLEFLLNKIRELDNIKGIRIRDQDYKLRAFADDLVVTLAQPTESVIHLMETINQYGKVSGFKVNHNKTKIIVKNMSIQQKQELSEITGFEIVKKVKYLGVYISASNAKLYKNNYGILWQQVQKDLENWKNCSYL